MLVRLFIRPGVTFAIDKVDSIKCLATNLSEFTSQHGFSSNDFGSSELCPFVSLNVKQIFLFFLNLSFDTCDKLLSNSMNQLIFS